MAVIEIAKIQVRRGQEQQTGVPPLAGGEFAWAADTENLYIGLKREDGGARDANVRILTENDLRNIFSVSGSTLISSSSSYIYRSGTNITAYSTGSVIYTDGSDGKEKVRRLQDKLDDLVSLRDFGVLGDGGVNMQDEIIQMAVNHLYATSESYDFSFENGANPPAKILHIPTGEYSVGGTIYLPKGAHLVGEGIDKTILVLKSTGEHVFQTFDASQGFSGGDNDQRPPIGIFTITDTSKVTDIGIPSNIHIENMTIRFETTEDTTLTGALSLISLDCAENAVIRRVKFEGNFDEDRIADINYAAVDLRGYNPNDSLYPMQTTANVLFEDCEFLGLYAGITSNYDVRNVTVRNCFFHQLLNGVALNKPKNPNAVVGPRFVRIENNRFVDIMEDAFYVGENGSTTSTYHTSIGNQYINVGNQGQREDFDPLIDVLPEAFSTGTSVITFLTKGNTSINDYFDRQHWQDQNGGFTTFNPIITGRAVLSRTEMSTATVDSASSAVIMRLPITGHQQYLTIKYSCYVDLGASESIDRMGNIQFFIKAGADPEIIISDDYSYTYTDGALYWGATVDSDYKFIEVRVYNPDPADGGEGYSIEVGFQPNLIL
jgi:hypothetical protein